MKYPLDVSMLTKEEIQQFNENRSVLETGDESVVIYMRYSSSSQTEQSIEGQLRDIITFCKLRNYCVRGVYIDRATSASKDIRKRVNFIQMISDSDKKLWEYVVVWKLDRFARNRKDSAIYKMRLRKNGVRVISATENLSDNPESILLESVLEGMAEFYSAELSQKIRRGQRESAIKCQVIGGYVPLGYKKENKKLVIDPSTAGIVREAFELYAQGWRVSEICEKFNKAGYLTAKHTQFNKNSFKCIFRNEKYMGLYRFNDIVVENGVPAIVSKELFEEVNRRLQKNALAPARGKAKVDYLLSGKIFCGHCGQRMNGESGRGHTGIVYNYYICSTRKHTGKCKKKTLKKELIEDWVATDALNLLTPDVIDQIADAAISRAKIEENRTGVLTGLRARRNDVQKGINNMLVAVEKGVVSDTLISRINSAEEEIKILDRRIADEEKNTIQLEKQMIVQWLTKFVHADITDDKIKRQLIDLLVNSVTVWDLPDDSFEIKVAYNLTTCKSKTFRTGDGFGYGESTCSIGCISELSFLGTICIHTFSQRIISE